MSARRYLLGRGRTDKSWGPLWSRPVDLDLHVLDDLESIQVQVLQQMLCQLDTM
jgi:hypothetical protein